VLSTSGVAVAGARVSLPSGAAAVTGPGGEFVLGGVPATDRLAVTVSADGFAPTTAIYRVLAGLTVSREIRVLRRGPSVRIDVAAGGVVAFADGGRVTIAPNSFEGVKAVNVQVAYYDPAVSEVLAAAPGDFAATEADGTRSQLQTSGMVDVLVTDDAGQRVDLAEGRTATINFPDRDGGSTQDWGLYGFDPATGDWVREGDAPVDPDGTQRAEVDTFERPWNSDQEMNTTCIRIRTVDRSGAPRPGASVGANGVNWSGPTGGMTDANGFVDILVKASSQVTITVGPFTQVITSPAASPNCTFVGTFAW
jgi:hypothetical protein